MVFIFAVADNGPSGWLILGSILGGVAGYIFLASLLAVALPSDIWPGGDDEWAWAWPVIVWLVLGRTIGKWMTRPRLAKAQVVSSKER